MVKVRYVSNPKVFVADFFSSIWFFPHDEGGGGGGTIQKVSLQI